MADKLLLQLVVSPVTVSCDKACRRACPRVALVVRATATATSGHCVMLRPRRELEWEKAYIPSEPWYELWLREIFTSCSLHPLACKDPYVPRH